MILAPGSVQITVLGGKVVYLSFYPGEISNQPPSHYQPSTKVLSTGPCRSSNEKYLLGIYNLAYIFFMVSNLSNTLRTHHHMLRKQ